MLIAIVVSCSQDPSVDRARDYTHIHNLRTFTSPCVTISIHIEFKKSWVHTNIFNSNIFFFFHIFNFSDSEKLHFHYPQYICLFDHCIMYDQSLMPPSLPFPMQMPSSHHSGSDTLCQTTSCMDALLPCTGSDTPCSCPSTETPSHSPWSLTPQDELPPAML